MIHAGGRAGSHHEAKGRFLQCCESAYKSKSLYAPYDLQYDHQVHRDFLITLYGFTVAENSITDRKQGYVRYYSQQQVPIVSHMNQANTLNAFCTSSQFSSCLSTKSSEAHIVCQMSATSPTHLILLDTNANARYDAP